MLVYWKVKNIIPLNLDLGHSPLPQPPRGTAGLLFSTTLHGRMVVNMPKLADISRRPHLGWLRILCTHVDMRIRGYVLVDKANNSGELCGQIRDSRTYWLWTVWSSNSKSFCLLKLQTLYCPNDALRSPGFRSLIRRNQPLPVPWLPNMVQVLLWLEKSYRFTVDALGVQI